MFNSRHTDYDIIDATPFRRDIVKELTDFLTGRPVRYQKSSDGLLVHLGEVSRDIDRVLRLELAD